MLREVPRERSWSEWFDSAIGFFAPGWAARRAAYRLSYRAARSTRIGPRRGRHGAADFHLEQTFDRRRMVDISRNLERDNFLAESMLSRSTESVVGCGYGLQVLTKNARWNALCERLWSEWAQAPDVRGMSTWSELLAMKFRSHLRDGDVGTILLSDGLIQLVESDQISSPTGVALAKGPSGSMVDGIVLDRRGMPTSYFVVDDPDPINSSIRHQPHTLVPATDFIFLPRRTRLGQTRGIPVFSTIAPLLEQIEGNIEAVTVAARMAACFGLVFEKNRRTTGLPKEEGSDGVSRRKMHIEPGMIHETAIGDKVHTLSPSQPTTNFPDFLRMLGRFAGLALGLPLEVAYMDYSQTNYSSARASMLQAQQVWRCHQKTLKGYSTKVYEWKVLNWIREGLLPARPDALQHSWTTPGWKWVDPEKELKAAMGAIDAGLDTRTSVALRQGDDFAEIVAQLKKERELLEDAGLPDVRSTITRDPSPEPSGEPGIATPAPGGSPSKDGDGDDDEDMGARRLASVVSDVRAGAWPAKAAIAYLERFAPDLGTFLIARSVTDAAAARTTELREAESRAAEQASAERANRLEVATLQANAAPPVVNVTVPVTVEPSQAPDVSLTVTPASVQVPVTVEAPKAPDVSLSVEAPRAPDVTVTAPVELNVEMKGGDKHISIERDPEGRIRGADVEAVED